MRCYTLLDAAIRCYTLLYATTLRYNAAMCYYARRRATRCYTLPNAAIRCQTLLCAAMRCHTLLYAAKRCYTPLCVALRCCALLCAAVRCYNVLDAPICCCYTLLGADIRCRRCLFRHQKFIFGGLKKFILPGSKFHECPCSDAVLDLWRNVFVIGVIVLMVSQENNFFNYLKQNYLTLSCLRNLAMRPKHCKNACRGMKCHALQTYQLVDFVILSSFY